MFRLDMRLQGRPCRKDVDMTGASALRPCTQIILRIRMLHRTAVAIWLVDLEVQFSLGVRGEAHHATWVAAYERRCRLLILTCKRVVSMRSTDVQSEILALVKRFRASRLCAVVGLLIVGRD